MQLFRVFSAIGIFFTYANRLKLKALDAYYRDKIRRVGQFSHLTNPLRIQGPENIIIGEHTIIGHGGWLASTPIAEAESSLLEIGNYCHIGDFCHIYAVKHIKLDDQVLIANHVYITDNYHGFEQIDVPIIKNPIHFKKEVYIGEGSWIGENVCIISANVGKHCVVGANSVVTHDLPDYCVAVGSPAKIIKRYNFKNKRWQKTNSDGSFI